MTIDGTDLELDAEIGIEAARALVHGAMCAAGYTDAEAAVITDQIVECELRGVPNAGLSRALTLVELTARMPPPTGMRTTRQTPVSAVVEGGGACGYLVAHAATELAIEKASSAGIAAVAANDTWYTGMYVHYLELATRAGLVGIAMGNSGPHVAPHGSAEAVLGTNPLGFGFPTGADPVIFDASTSSLVLSELHMALRLGQAIPPGAAFDAQGLPTTDPAEALAGAIAVWGGHRGYGLSIAVQLFGALAGAPTPGRASGHGFLFLAIRPDLFGDEGEFLTAASALADRVRAAEPLPGGDGARLPFERSARVRRERLARGSFPVSGLLVAQLEEAAGTSSDRGANGVPGR